MLCMDAQDLQRPEPQLAGESRLVGGMIARFARKSGTVIFGYKSKGP